MVFRSWQAAGGVVLVGLMVGGCGDDGPSAETDTEADTSGSPTSSPTTTPSTSNPSTSSTGPDTTTETTEDPTTGSTEPTTDATTMTETTESPTTDATGSTTAETTDTTTAVECTDGDDDGDMICNGEDLCDDLLATHCLEVGIDASAMFSVYSLNTNGIFDDLLDQDIVVGVSLDVDSIAEPAACDAVDTVAKQYSATVVGITMRSTDDTADAYLQDDVIAELALEGVTDVIRFIGQGDNPAIFQATFSAGMTPGHRFALGDNASYMPDCDQVDIDATVSGTNAVFQLEYVDMTGTMTERIQGLGAAYTLYPVGG